MTIPYHIHIGPFPSHISENQVLDVITKTFREVDETFNKYNPSSELSTLNSWEKGLPFPCSSRLFYVLKQCDLFYRISDGRFDPTISPLKELWKEALSRHSVPSKEDLAALPPIGWENLCLHDSCQVIKSDASIAIDLGGIAKGYAVDLLVESLSDIGITNMYVEWGGEIRTQGNHPEDRAWKIGILSPCNGESPKVVEVREKALATSGDSIQSWSVFHNGKERRLSHFLDPKKLQPLPGSTNRSVTIKYDSCLVADALATIFCTLSPEEDPYLFLHERVLPVFPSAEVIS